MSLTKDASGNRSVQVEVEVPGTPEEVWRAIATGPGISSWFVPTRSEERQGGEQVCTFGPGMDCPSTITEWQPPKRFVAEGDMGGPGSPRVATEWTVEPLAGETCRVRVMHSLVAGTDPGAADATPWEKQLKGLEEGWPIYFRILRMYLAGHRGMPCSAMHFVAFSKELEPQTWQKAGGALGLLNVAEGQDWNCPEGLPRMAGVVDHLGRGSHKNTLVLRLKTPAPGSAYIGAFACGGMVMVCMSVYLYGEKARAAAERDEPLWQHWFSEQFPMPQMG